MKGRVILKVGISKTRLAKSCHYEYPEEWDAEKVHVLAYEEHPGNLGEVIEYCMCVTDQATATRLLKNSRVVEISKPKANEFGRRWRPAITRITNPLTVIAFAKKLISITGLKGELEKYFSQEELDSVDEKKKIDGIGKSKKFDIENFV